MTSPSRCHPICPWYLPVTFCPMFRVFFLLLPMSMAVQRCHPSLRWSPERPLAERVSFRNFPMVSPKELHFHRKSCKSSEVFFLSQMLNVWYIHLHFAIFIVNVGKCTMHFVSRFSKRDMFDMFQISIWKTLPESWSLSSVLLNHPVFQGRFFSCS